LLAREATQLILGNLERVVKDPQDVPAREAMALAATYAGLAFSNCGVALVHGLEYPLGALVHCSHGAGNGTLLPYVMEFNLPACTDRYAELAQALGAPAGSAEMQSRWLIEQVIALRQRIGIRHRLREYGLAKEDLHTIAEKTSRIERLMTLNPRSATKEELREILDRAF
jgi:alcohol dehydrogenase class IV